MASAILDGIATPYEIIGAGPPLLMYAPSGRGCAVFGDVPAPGRNPQIGRRRVGSPEFRDKLKRG
jgi:hypothetical protein